MKINAPAAAIVLGLLAFLALLGYLDVNARTAIVGAVCTLIAAALPVLVRVESVELEDAIDRVSQLLAASHLPSVTVAAASVPSPPREPGSPT